MARYYDVKATPITREEAITGYLVLFRDITDRWRAEQELRQANHELKTRLQEIEILQRELRLQATRDPLTNLYNRRYLEEILEKELARAARKSSPVSIIMLDADKFKRVNDIFGHKAGDRALQSLAGIILKYIRSSDIACRYGGEEFVIVMPNTEPEIARERAEHIRHDFYQVEFDGPESAGQTSLSIGIAAYPRSGLRADAMLDAADQAMYAAKRSGGNRIKLHAGNPKSDTLRLDPRYDSPSVPPRRRKGK
jgi:diguanylate cyclase (GGDEF)-like protein